MEDEYAALDEDIVKGRNTDHGDDGMGAKGHNGRCTCRFGCNFIWCWELDLKDIAFCLVYPPNAASSPNRLICNTSV